MPTNTSAIALPERYRRAGDGDAPSQRVAATSVANSTSDAP
ncbi:hypothetical protein ACFQJD_11970 [Haloplanus sp. GCM10025708]